jgi:peptidyl-prolyl cis-trans isomerase D
MLDYFREKNSSLIIKFFAGLVILGMAFWGLSNYKSRPNSPNQIKIGEVQITKSEINRRVYQLSKSGQYLGTQAEVKQLVLRSMITQAAAEKHLDSQGILLPLKAIQQSLVSSSFMTPFELNNLKELIKQKRNTLEAHLNPKYFYDSVSLSEKELKAYYTKNSHKTFFNPEKAKFSYIILSQPQIKKKIHPTQLMLKNYYNLTQDRYTQPQKFNIKLYKYILNAKKEGKKLANLKFNNHDTIAYNKIIKTVDKTAWETIISKRWINKAAVPIQLRNVDLKPGDYLINEYNGQDGTYIIRILNIKKKVIKPFSKVYTSVKNAYLQNEANKIFNQKYDQITDLAFMHTDSLNPIAKAMSLKIKVTPWIKKDSLKTVFSNKKNLKKAFSDEILIEKINSNPIAIDNEHYIVFRLLTHQPQQKLPYTAVRDEISATVRALKAYKLMLSKAKKISSEYKNGTILKSLQRKYTRSSGVDWHKQISLMNLDYQSDFNKYIFSLAKPSSSKPSFGIYARKENHTVIIVWLNKLTPSSLEKIPDSLTNELSILDFISYQYAVYLPYSSLTFNL